MLIGVVVESFGVNSPVSYTMTLYKAGLFIYSEKI